MAINYADERFAQVEAEKNNQLNEVTNTYNGMINNSDSYYQGLIDEANRWGDKQTEIQNQQTEQTIKEINQNQEKTEREYQKETKGSYADYQRQLASNTAGMINSGLQNSGYSESSQVSMYNTYQNRLALARQGFNDAVQNYENQRTQARLANSAALAQIAHDTLQRGLELSLQGFQYKNQLTLDLMNQKQNISNTYWSRRQDIQTQINTENALAEQVRQFNENMSLQRAKMAEDARQFNATLALKKQKAASSGSSSTAKLTQTEQVYKSVSSPILSSNKANQWSDALMTKYKSGITASQLASSLDSALKNKTITDKDKDKILKAYGLK